MKIRSYFILAWKMVFNMKKYSLKVMSALAGIIFICSGFLSYRSTLISKMDYLTYENASCCYVQLNQLVDRSLFPEIDEMKVRSSYCSALYTIDSVLLEVDGEVRRGTNTEDYDFGKTTLDTDRNVYFNLDSVAETQGEMVLITRQDEKEYNAKFVALGDELCIEGKLELGENEVIVSDYMLERFGYVPSEFSQLIGHDITFKLEDGERVEYWLDEIEEDRKDISKANILLGPVKIVGVINSNYYRLNAHGDDAQIVVAAKNPQQKYFSTPRYYYYSKQFETSVDLVTKLKTLGLVDQSNVTLDVYSTLNILNNVIFRVLFFVMIMLMIALMSNYLLTSFFSYHEARFFLQMNRAIGLSTHQLWRVKLIENVFLLLGGICISYGCLEIINYCVSILSEKRMDMEILLQQTTMLKYLWVSIVLVMVCIIISTLANTFALSRRPICEDLSGG